MTTWIGSYTANHGTKRIYMQVASWECGARMPDEARQLLKQVGEEGVLLVDRECVRGLLTIIAAAEYPDYAVMLPGKPRES